MGFMLESIFINTRWRNIFAPFGTITLSEAALKPFACATCYYIDYPEHYAHVNKSRQGKYRH